MTRIRHLRHLWRHDREIDQYSVDSSANFVMVVLVFALNSVSYCAECAAFSTAVLR